MSQADLLGLLVPFLTALTVSAGAVFIARRTRLSSRGREAAASLICAVAAGGGVAAGFILMFSWPGIPPHSRWQWLVVLPVAAAIAGWAIGNAASIVRRGFLMQAMPAVIATIGWLAIVAFTVRLPAFDQPWLWAAAAGALGIFTALAVRRATAIAPLPTALLLVIVLAATSGLLLMSGHARFTQITAAILAALAGVLVARWTIALRTWPVRAECGTFAAAALLLAVMVYLGWAYTAEHRRHNLAFAAIAILPLTVIFLPGFVRLPAGGHRQATANHAARGKRRLLTSGLILLAAVVVATLALRPVWHTWREGMTW